LIDNSCIHCRQRIKISTTTIPEKTEAVSWFYHLQGWRYRGGEYFAELADILKVGPITWKLEQEIAKKYGREFLDHLMHWEQ
jgi:hypothetical protein